MNVKSEIHGLVKIDKAFVDSVNAIDEVVLSTIRTNMVVQAGASLVGTRVIPLIVDEAKIVEVERLAGRSSRCWLHLARGEAVSQVACRRHYDGQRGVQRPNRR